MSVLWVIGSLQTINIALGAFILQRSMNNGERIASLEARSKEMGDQIDDLQQTVKDLERSVRNGGSEPKAIRRPKGR